MSRYVVEPRRREPDETEVRAGVLPSARTWQDLAALANYLAGQGACLVAGTAIDATIGVGGTSTLHFRTKPRSRSIYRLWSIFVRVEELDDSGATVSIRAPALTGTSATYPLSTGRAVVPITYLEPVTPSSAETELTIDFTTVGTGTIFIDGIRCVELPRGTIPDGVSMLSERPGERIYAPTVVSASVLGVQTVLDLADPRRIGLFHWAVPAETLAVSSSSGSYTDLLTLSVPILVPKLGYGSVLERVSWSVYAKMASAETTGYVKLTTSHSGVSDEVAITDTTLAWIPSRIVSVDCEDMAAEDGRQTAASPTWDLLQVQIKGTGTVAIQIYGVSVWAHSSSPYFGPEGTVAATLAALTDSGAGTVSNSGSLSKTLAALTDSGAGTVSNSGSLSKTLAALTDSATGTVVTPFLDLSSGGTFARALEASYYLGAPTTGSSAFLAWASSGTRRVENRGDGNGSCLLMERAATNYILRSRELGNAAWTAGTATLTADANGGPDATGTADQENTASGQYGSYQGTPGPGGRIVASIWARAVSGTVSGHQLNILHNGASASLLASVLNVTTTYGRNNAAASATTDSGLVVVDGRDLTGTGGQTARAQDVYLDLAQLEAGYYPTSAIRTTSATVTRPADTLSYTTGNYPSEFLTSGMIIVFAPDASSSEFETSLEDWRLTQVGANDYVRIRGIFGFPNYCTAELVCGGSVVATKTITFSRAQVLTITAKPSAGSITVSGATTGDGTNTGTGAAWASSSTIYIGGDNAGGNNATGRFVGASIVAAL